MEISEKISTIREKVDDKITQIEKKINSLRIDGEDKISALKVENKNILRNKKLDSATKKSLIKNNKKLILEAKKVKEQNKEEVNAEIKKARTIFKEEYSEYILSIKEAGKKEKVDVKEQYAKNIVAIKDAHSERVSSVLKEKQTKLNDFNLEGKLSKIENKKSSEALKIKAEYKDISDNYDSILKNENIAFKSKLFEEKTNLKKQFTEIKDALHRAHRHKVHSLSRVQNDKFNIGDLISQRFENYVYHFSLSDFLLRNGLYIVIIAVFVVCVIVAPILGRGDLLTIGNILAIFEQSSTRMFLALGVAGLILLAGTDLSIGRMVGLGAVITVVILHPGNNIIQFFNLGAWNFDAIPMFIRVLLALFLSVLFCSLFSTIAGFFTAKFKMHPFISTLGTQLIIYGLLVYSTSGTNSGFIDTGIKNMLAGKLFGVFPTLIIYAVIVIAVVWFVWNKTKFGKNIYAVGGNAEAANVSGISVFWTTLGVFIMAGILYGIGSFLEGIRLGAASSGTGSGWELDAIAACVVGGISFSGGIGKVKGAVIGVLIFTALTYALGFLGIDTNLQFVLKGVIIIAAVTLDSVKYIKKK